MKVMDLCNVFSPCLVHYFFPMDNTCCLFMGLVNCLGLYVIAVSFYFEYVFLSLNISH